MFRICARKGCNNSVKESEQGRTRKYCSAQCKSMNQKEHYDLSDVSKLQNFSPAQKGALSELRASVDLMLNGYEVFRAVSPACSCDLIALKNNKTIRIEVRTATKRIDGSLKYPISKIRADVVAAVFGNTVVYFPPLDNI